MSMLPKFLALGLATALGSVSPERQIAYDSVIPDSPSINQLWIVTYLNVTGQEVPAVAKLASGDNLLLIAADHARMESMMPTGVR
jgi:hypothetical protein